MNSEELFNKAVDRLIELEGGLVNHPSDPGGITKYGISLRYLRSVRPGAKPLDIIDMTKEEAKEIYWENWWVPMGLHRLPPKVAIQMLDAAVSMGQRQAVKELQRACRWHGVDLDDDGLLGPLTVKGVVKIGDALLPTLKAQIAGFYRSLVAERRDFQVFAKGWQNRAAEKVEV